MRRSTDLTEQLTQHAPLDDARVAHAEKALHRWVDVRVQRAGVVALVRLEAAGGHHVRGAAATLVCTRI